MTRPTGALLDYFGAVEAVGSEPRPSWNIAPTNPVRIVTERQIDGAVSRRLETARWGLVPSWEKNPRSGSRRINARSETVTELSSFRAAAVKRRALVVAEGYYEWEKRGGVKIPTYLHSGAEDLLSFAGLYEFWPDPDLPEDSPERWTMTCTILTTSAPDALGHIHDRTPVIVPPSMRGDWLDPGATSKTDVWAMLEAFPEPVLTPRIVGAEVGNVRNDSPELIEAVD